MIKYLGSKRVLLPAIEAVIASLPEVRTVVDFFSGTSRVGHALKRRGYRVLANDVLSYAEVLARCYVQADRDDHFADAARLVAEFNALAGQPGYITETFCERSRFFQPHNGERIDAIRAAIAAKTLAPELEAVMLVSLMEAADRVDSTTGVQMAYLKRWSARSHRDLELRVPELLPRARHGKGAAHQLDALDAAQRLTGDLAYLDPPYNQHSYLGNYHVWETLVRHDSPEAYGVACKRLDCRTRKSAFNRRRDAEPTLRAFLDAVDCPFLLVSFSDEGFISRAAMESMLQEHGDVHTLAHDHPRYVGARIGIHNPQGEKVGIVGRLRNTEYLYLVVPAGYVWSPGRVTPPHGATTTATAGRPPRRPSPPRSASRS